MTKPSAPSSYAVLSGVLLVSLTLPVAAQNSEPGKKDSEQRPQPVITFRITEPQGISVKEKVDPTYPPQALSARYQGTVTLDAAVEADGAVSSTKIASGHPPLEGAALDTLLARAALDAVRQWKFDPNPQLPAHVRVVVQFRLAADTATVFINDSAMEILHRTAEAYRQSGETEFNVTIQKLENGGEKVSERSAVRRPGFDQIDQHVQSALIAREERYIQQGKPIAIVIVRVTRDEWPEGTLLGAGFAMYRIDQKTFEVYKVSTYAGTTTEIAFYGDELPTPGMKGEGVSMIGMEAPDFTLPDPSGTTVHLRDLRGKVVVVDFWATWCPPCRALMPHIQKLHEQLAAKGLTILGLDVGEDAATVANFAKERSYTFPLLLDAEPEVARRYFVQSYPTTFVIDRAGRIAFRDMGSGEPADLQAAVEKALLND
jgi:TonB family protein